MIAPPKRVDLPYLSFLAVSFVYGLAFSWQRWGNPLVDCGREMNQPFRLVGGEMLYSDVRHIYGPLSPYLNSFLYRIFGASLDVLYANGIISAVIIIGLCYWLSRQVMGPMASLAVSLSVMWLCAFKQAGNYILPYSYNALHGCVFGLATLSCLVKAVPVRNADPLTDDGGNQIYQRSIKWMFAAGLLTALTFLSKTEMGIAAFTTGFLTGFFLAYPSWKKAFSLSLSFALPAVILIALVYGFILARVGWHTLSNDSFLFFQNIPPELIYFNKRVSGLDRPLESLLSMFGALVRIGILFFAVATISLMVTRWKEGRHKAPQMAVPDAGRATFTQLALLLVVSAIVILSISIAGIISWDNGPYLAMPVLLAIFLITELRAFLKDVANQGFGNRDQVILLIIGVFALVSLFRVILRVRSGGAYSSYLLPASVILFTYILGFQFTRLIKDQRARTIARNLVISLVIADAVLTSFLHAYRYRIRNTYPIVTEKGTMVSVPDMGMAFTEATTFINQHTSPDDYVAVMPEGTSLLFFTGRKNPLREEITTPGFLDSSGEERAIRRFQETKTKLIFIANRATSEFGPGRFGIDYNQQLMTWIKDHYEEGEVFGPSQNPHLRIGGAIFFLRAYHRKENTIARSLP